MDTDSRRPRLSDAIKIGLSCLFLISITILLIFIIPSIVFCQTIISVLSHAIPTRFIPLPKWHLSLRRRTLSTTQYQTNRPLHPSFLKKRIASSHQLRERFLRIAFSQRGLHGRLKHAEKRVHQLLIVQAGRRSGLILRFQQRSLHRPMQILDVLVRGLDRSAEFQHLLRVFMAVEETRLFWIVH